VSPEVEHILYLWFWGVVERQRNKGLSGDKEDRVGVGVTGGDTSLSRDKGVLYLYLPKPLRVIKRHTPYLWSRINSIF